MPCDTSSFHRFRLAFSSPAGLCRRWTRPAAATLACGGLLLLTIGCSTVSDPANPPGQRLKRFVNPLGARAEREAFEQQVKDDPFPPARSPGA